MVREGRSWSGYEKNRCFFNLGPSASGNRFANISAVSGLDQADDSRAVSVVDWDHDGDLDLWVRNRTAPRLRFFRNEVGRSNGDFIALKLIGNGRNTNRDAIGARVEIRLRDQTEHKLIKTVRAGESFLSQNSSWVHIGLGVNPSIGSVVIRWPNAEKTIDTITDLKPNRRYIVREGEGWAELPVRDQATLAIEPGKPTLPDSETFIRAPALSMVNAPSIRGLDFEGRELVTNSIGRWTLVNLWASWCPPCVSELKQFTRHADKIKKAGIRVIARGISSGKVTK